MTPEALGAFIDAVYAIAITILALEIPDESASFASSQFLRLLLEYSIAFAVLFAFWLQHRRLNARLEQLTRGVLWLNALVMLLVCLIPRATTLVFAYGGNVTLKDYEALFRRGPVQPSLAALADGLYVCVVFLADAVLLALTCAVIKRQPCEVGLKLRRTKIVVSALLSLCLALSLTLPYPNRYFALLLPLMLFFEQEVTSWLEKHRAPLTPFASLSLWRRQRPKR